MLGRLEALSNLHGVSGSEHAVRAYIRKELEPLGLSMKTDGMGNLYVHKPGAGRRIMACAHMDEVGMLVTKIEDNGMLRYDEAGLDARVCVSKRVVIGKDGLAGVIGAKAIHQQTREEFERALKHDELYIDIGAKDKQDAQKYVKVGDYVSFDTKFAYFGDGLVSGKALDDRIGCAILMELLKSDYECDFTAVFTVQEENGLRGANAAAYNVRPELCIVLEGTTANDMPEVPGHKSVTRVGMGPAISFMDRTTMVRPFMFDALRALAREHNIPWQLRQGTAGGTDGGVIHKALAGCISGGISVPCRYIHSPVSVASVSDIENAHRLADTFFKTKKFDEVLSHV